MDNRAQISAELLIIMAAIVGLAFFVIQSLSSNAHSYSDALKAKSQDLLKEIDKITA
ncbi:MAG: class III signal peptide-containing protein [Candidatus Micrarchaeota archaeon]